MTPMTLLSPILSPLLSARPRVRECACHLDLVCVGWHSNIDISTLSLKDDKHCVLAQSFGGYLAGFYALGDHLGHSPDLEALGLSVTTRPWSLINVLLSRLEHALLLAAWIAEVNERHETEWESRVAAMEAISCRL